MKYIKSILALFLCLSIFTACNTNKSETPDTVKIKPSSVSGTYVCDIANDGILGVLEKDWWIGSYTTNSKAPKTLSIEFENNLYNCEYEDSELNRLNWRTEDYYGTGNDITISVDSIDQTFRSFHKGRLTYEFLMKDLTDPHKEAMEIAKKYASKYIDISEYSLEENKPYSYSDLMDGEEVKIPLYTFRFIKYVDTYPTADEVYVQITSKGTLRTIHVDNIGAFDNVDLSNLDSREVENSIDKKIREIYSNKVTMQSYAVEKNTLTYSPEGDLIIVSDVILNIDNGHKTEVTLATVIS